MSDHEVYVAAFGEPVAAHISKLIEAERGSSEPRKLACDFAGERTNKERSGAQEHNDGDQVSAARKQPPLTGGA